MPFVRVLLFAVLAAACGAQASVTATPAQTDAPPSAAPTTAPAATPAPSRSPVSTGDPTFSPAGVLAFPTISEQPLAPGRYSSSPPFDIPFTFEVPEDGWESAHLHGEFFDIMQLIPGTSLPRRWIAFAHPVTIYGATDAAATDLTPDEAAELVVTNPGVNASPSSPFDFAGLDGVRVDLTADAENTHIFGGPDGDFGMDTDHDFRLAFVPAGDGLLLILVVAPKTELETAWAEAQPILDSVVLD